MDGLPGDKTESKSPNHHILKAGRPEHLKSELLSVVFNLPQISRELVARSWPCQPPFTLTNRVDLYITPNIIDLSNRPLAKSVQSTYISCYFTSQLTDLGISLDESSSQKFRSITSLNLTLPIYISSRHMLIITND